MNKHLREAFLRQDIKRKLKKKIKEGRKNLTEEANLYTTFVQPFTDVIQSVNLGAQDFLNSYLTFLRLFITFSPKKGKEILKKHDERKAKIAEKWKPLMERADEALSTGDADIIALVLAPQVFALSAVGQKAAEYGGDVKEFLNNTGLDGLVAGLIPGFKIVSKEVDDEKEEGRSLIDKMALLFFGSLAGRTLYDSYKSAKDLQDLKDQNLQSESVINEQANKNDLKKDLAEFFEDTGIMDEFKKDAEVVIQSLQETIKEFDEIYDAKSELIQSLIESDSLETFVDSFEKAGESIKDGELPATSSIEKDLKDAVEKLSSSEEFIEKVKEETKSDEISKEDLLKSASKVVFLDAKKSFENDMGGFESSLEKLKNDIGEQIQEVLPTEQGMSILEKSKNPAAKKAVDMIQKTKRKYSID